MAFLTRKVGAQSFLVNFKDANEWFDLNITLVRKWNREMDLRENALDTLP